MNKLYPVRYYDKKEDIPFQLYYDKGYRGVMFDIDNTLVPHNCPIDDKTKEFIDSLKAIGFSICLISNNSEERVKLFAEPLGVSYTYKAWKPSRKGYEEGMKTIGTDVNNTLFVGDQIYTDIWGANRANVYSILLDPINPKEEIQIILKRIPEKYIKWRYRKMKQLGKNEYDAVDTI